MAKITTTVRTQRVVHATFATVDAYDDDETFTFDWNSDDPACHVQIGCREFHMTAQQLADAAVDLCAYGEKDYEFPAKGDDAGEKYTGHLLMITACTGPHEKRDYLLEFRRGLNLPIEGVGIVVADRIPLASLLKRLAKIMVDS